jgi:hypothetical protein
LRIILHNVPEDGIRTDIDHRFGTKFRFFAKAGLHTAAAEDYNFYWDLP